jgi:hypothetical protein
MREKSFPEPPDVAGFFGFYHGVVGNATGIQLLLSVCFATFFKLPGKKNTSLYAFLSTLWLP